MSAANDASANEVLKIYRAATKTSLKEHQDAFDGAVGVYRARNQDASEKVARRAVERIICNSLWSPVLVTTARSAATRG